MEDDIDYGKDITLEELENLEEVNIEFDKNVGPVYDGTRPRRKEKFIKVVEK